MMGYISGYNALVHIGKHIEENKLKNESSKIKQSFGCTTCSNTNERAEQNPNTPNLPFAQQAYLSNVNSRHADYPMFEQYSDGYGFQQFSDSEKQYVLQSLGNLNARVEENTRLGKGAVGMVQTLAENLGTSGFSEGDKSLGGYLTGLQIQIDNAFQDREGMRKRIKVNEDYKQKVIADHADFNTKLTNLGDSDSEAKLDREELHRKIDTHSLHGGSDFLGGLLGSTTGIIALGLGAFLLLRSRK